MSTLGLESSRELENLVMEAVYAGLLDATMDPHRAELQVHSVAPLRDLEPGAIPPMMEKLSGWSDRCDHTLVSLEAEIESIKEKARIRQHEKKQAEDQVRTLVDFKDGNGGLSSLEKRVMGSREGRGLKWGGKRGVDEGADELMDVDVDEEGGGKVRSSRRKLGGV